MSDSAEKVKKIVVEHLGVEADKVTEEASFIDDLGADSLDIVELVMAFEEEFGVEIPDDAAEKIAAGDTEGGLALFVDGVEGPGAWLRQSEAVRQQVRDNAGTLLGQTHENRPPFSLADAQAIRTPTLFLSGTKAGRMLPAVTKALLAQVDGATLAAIPDATHPMYEQNPVAFARAVLDFLA